MGMKLQFKSYNPTREINEDMNSSNMTQVYGQKPLPNGQFYNDFIPRTSIESYPLYDSKDVLRQKMLEHEAIFKNQVYELHRLYRIQRDMMDEVRRNGSYKHQISMEGSSSSNRLPYQNPPEDSRKWNPPSIPLLNQVSSRPSNLGGDVIINSPLSCTNGTSQLQNDSTLKDLESSRPLKVRKKLFDLQLPADEYIDDTEDGEQVQENDPNNNRTKLFLGGKNEFRVVDTLKQDPLRARGSVKLADLNEPIQIEPPIGVDLLGRPVISQVRKSPFLALPQEFVNGSNNLPVETKGNGRGWLSYMQETGSSRSNPNSFPQCIQPEQQLINSHPVQFTPNTIPYYNQQLQPVGIFPHDNISRVDLWGEQKGRVLEIPNRIQERCNYGNNLESVLGSSSSSRMQSSYPFLNPPELPNSWPHSVLPWGNLNNPMNSYTQKLMPVQMHPSFNSSFGRNSQPSDQTQADNWQVTRMMNTPMLPSEQLSIRNGFYQGSSSSGPKQLSAAAGSFDYMNRSFKGSNFMELTSTKDMNLNAFPPNSCNEVAVRKDTQKIGEMLVNSQDQHLQVLPWLRAKPIVKTETASNIMDLNSPNQIYDVGVGAKDEKRILGVPIFGTPRPLGNHYPFVLPTTNASASTTRFSPELEDSKSNVKRILIDINVACDDTGVPDSTVPPAFIDKGKGSLKPENCRVFIDLNLCASDDEGDQMTQSDATDIAKSKVRVDIDLEAYPSDVGSDEEQENQPKAEHKKAEQEQEDVEVESISAAAEAIMAISTAPNVLSEDSILDPFESAMADSLLLLFDTISVSQTSNLVKKTNSVVEIDYYELMTLQLPETKEEDYMPHYNVTNFLERDEAGLSLLPNRPRRGQARRGRPRRDFQRDILPGLVSLSRHQITDDLQTFGGLMRATGHNWPAGSSRRNSGRGSGAPRGRRRAVAAAVAVVEPVPPPAPVVAVEQAPSSPPVIPQASLPAVQNIEVGLQDTNLTGWGKTTRRPRRQRCSAGNAIAVALT